MSELPRVLIVEDEETIRWSVAERLRADDLAVEEAATGRAAIERLEKSRFDLVILDLKLPDLNGMTILRRALELAPDLPVIILTAYGTVAGAVDAMRVGAYDYRTKPFSLEDLAAVIGRALEVSRLGRDVRAGQDGAAETFGSTTLVSASRAMRAVCDLVRKLGAADVATVLILGESGTGKGAVAHAIHAANPKRTGHPFVSVTCTAIPESLLESELFGHERGAFTDARQSKPGLIETANGGTLFLDEIGDMPLALQGKLLRFLEDRKFKRVGGTRDLDVDLRIAAATNCDLERAVADGRFRSDLYYRLKVVPVVIPPLRARVEDIAPLAGHFMQAYAREFKKPARIIEPGALDVLLHHPWPGNVRELRNVMERAVLFSDGERITRRDLLLDPPRTAGVAAVAPAHAPGGAGGGLLRELLLTRAGVDIKALEQSLVKQALELTQGNCSEAGRLLGLSREQVKYRAEKFGIALPPQGAPRSGPD